MRIIQDAVYCCGSEKVHKIEPKLIVVIDKDVGKLLKDGPSDFIERTTICPLKNE